MIPAGQASVHSFRVVPNVPAALQPLLELAYNLWWSWHPEAVQLFVRVDRDLWEESGHNPVKMLGMVDQKLLERIAQDQSYLHALSLVHAAFKHHNERMSWCQRQHAALVAPEDAGARPLRIAYFSAEFGLTECLQIYSGGLGCLAGDHLKSASELGVPVCAVGLLYRCGYFHQYLNADGWQQERYPDQDFANQPVHRVRDAKGEQVRVSIELPGRAVTLGVWKCSVGRVPLYLLDANMPENSREDRNITHTLYGGDVEMRIKQEIALGIGGVRALQKVGEQPTVFHINEGHAAFLSLERIAQLREQHGVGFDQALQAAAAGNIFTTHTPVPAGIDRFAPQLIDQYLGHMLPRLGVDLDRLLGMGRSNPFDPKEFFSMAVLAIRSSQFCNGVSRLHGEVSRNMWSSLFPGVPANEIPIGHVTNGVHPRSWIASNLVSIFDRYISPDWQLDPKDHELWKRVDEIPDEELWRHRQRQREKLITWARQRIRTQLRARNAGFEEIERSAAAIDPDIFTIGFARRFATYKRGTLMLRELERLKQMLGSSDRPVQFLIAGKAHPADGPGKDMIRQIARLAFSRDDHLNRIVFIEDYDIEVGRMLVQGCDMWLNTPTRGMEASGTSGMKAAMNGVVNCSILDGWWDEAFGPGFGFAIGAGEEYSDPEERDRVENRALMDLLERQVLPEFYERDAAGIPRKWVQRMKRCIATLTPQFSTQRMVADYVEQYYLIAHGLSESMLENKLSAAGTLARQIDRLRAHWGGLRIGQVRTDAGPTVQIRTPVKVEAEVDLAGLKPEEVHVQVYHGLVSSIGDLTECVADELLHVRSLDNDNRRHLFSGSFHPGSSGQRGFTVRVIPRDDRLVGTLIPGLILWNHGAAATAVPAGSAESARREMAHA